MPHCLCRKACHWDDCSSELHFPGMTAISHMWLFQFKLPKINKVEKCSSSVTWAAFQAFYSRTWLVATISHSRETISSLQKALLGRGLLWNMKSQRGVPHSKLLKQKTQSRLLTSQTRIQGGSAAILFSFSPSLRSRDPFVDMSSTLKQGKADCE